MNNKHTFLFDIVEFRMLVARKMQVYFKGRLPDIEAAKLYRSCILQMIADTLETCSIVTVTNVERPFGEWRRYWNADPNVTSEMETLLYRIVRIPPSAGPEIEISLDADILVVVTDINPL